MDRRRSFAGRLRPALFLLTLALAGCPDSNLIGVQDFGTVNGRVIDARSNLPVSGAVVSVGSLEVVRVGTDGVFSLPHIPVGTQTVTVRANGYSTVTANVIVQKGQTSDAGLVALPSLSNPGGAIATALPLPAAPAPSASPGPAGPSASPAAAASSAPSPSSAPQTSPSPGR